MVQAEVLTLWLAVALYTGATVLYAYYFMEKVRVVSVAATLLTGLGFISHTAAIGLQSRLDHGTALTGANSLVLAAWALVFVYFVVEHLVRVKVYGTVLVPSGLAALVLAQLFQQAHPLAGAEAVLVNNSRVGFHVALIVFANAGFAVGAVASATYLVMEAQLKHHTTNRLFKRLPSLGQTDQVARRAVVWAFPVYSAGLLLGVLQAVANVPGWLTDPRIIISAGIWVIYAVYLYLRYGRRVSGRTAAWLSLAGMVLVVALGMLSRLGTAGFHIFGVS